MCTSKKGREKKEETRTRIIKTAVIGHVNKKIVKKSATIQAIQVPGIKNNTMLTYL